MKKLILCLAAVSIIACTGCTGKETGTDTANATENNAAVTSAAEDGKFNFDSTVGNMKICGQSVSLPCKFSDLGEGFEYSDPIEDTNNNYMFTTFMYNGTDIGTIYLELRDDGKYEESQIVSMILNSKSEAEINGVTMESSEEDVKKALGDDFEKNDYTLAYGSDEKGSVSVLMNGMTDTPMSVTIIMPKE